MDTPARFAALLVSAKWRTVLLMSWGTCCIWCNRNANDELTIVRPVYNCLTELECLWTISIVRFSFYRSRRFGDWLCLRPQWM
jgi:hypothetical protein